MSGIKNLTNRLVTVQLNNGRSLHLPPRFLASDIDDSLLANNSQIKKLEERYVISVQSSKEEASPAKQPAKHKSASGKPATDMKSGKE
jgi:hypothetical protein